VKKTKACRSLKLEAHLGDQVLNAETMCIFYTPYEKENYKPHKPDSVSSLSFICLGIAAKM